MADTHFRNHQQESSRLRLALNDIEAKAGIRESLENFEIYHGNNDLRRLYFSVRDKELRKELISAQRDLWRQLDGYTPARILDAEQELRALELKGFSPPWIVPVLIVAFAVWAGWSLATTPGALAGAMAGFFMGSAYIGRSRNDRDKAVMIARNELDELKEERKKEQRPLGISFIFSEQEEESGGEDEGSQPEPDIHWYARLGRSDLVKQEIDRGVSVELKNDEDWGSRPLHRAAANGNSDTVRVLLEAGADPAAPNKLHGFTPLHSAAAAGCAECVMMLMDAGSPVDARDNYESLPVHRAAESGDADTIRALIVQGADIASVEGQFGSMPLHQAAHKGQIESVKVLLELGADPSAANFHGVAPLDFARMGKGKNFERVADMLRGAGGIGRSTESDEVEK